MELAKEKTPWYHEPWVVILLIIFVLGPFGLPLVYKSPRFNFFWKIVITLAAMAYTAYLVLLTFQMVKALASELAPLKVLLS